MHPARSCRRCGADFSPTDYDVRTSRRLCPSCKREEIKIYMRGWKLRPEVMVRRRAQGHVERAVRAGRLVPQPCELCSQPKAEAHHDDYARPLDVRWLCRPHHRELHKQFRRQSAATSIIKERGNGK